MQSQESGGPRPLLCLVKVSIFYRTHYSEMVHGASKPKRLLLVESALSLLKVSTNAFTQIYYDTIIINRHLNIGLVYFSAKLLTMCKKRTLWFKTTRQWSMKVFLTLWTNIPISEMWCFVKFRWHLSCSSHPDLCNMHGCRHPLAAARHCTNQTVVGRGFINQNPFIRFLIFGWWVQRKRSWGLQL